MQGIRWVIIVTAAALVAFGPATLLAEGTSVNQETLEKEFVGKLTGAVLQGNFTILGQESVGDPRPDKYTITKVEKKDGNNWLFVARVEYEKGTFPVAIKVPVEWAGRTPVICVTDLEIPLVGTGKFGARVLFDGDMYAGTWSHDAVGGHMFGRILREEKSLGPEKK